MFDSNNQYTPNTSFIPPSNRPYNSWGRNNLYNRFSRLSCRLRSHNPPGCWIVIVVVVALALAISISIVGVSYLQNQPNFDPLNISALLPVLIVVGGGSLAVLALLQKTFRRASPGKLFSRAIVFVIAVILVVFLYWNFFINPCVGMTATSFTSTSIQIRNGQTLHFQNPANGVPQTLCTGFDQECQAESGAPESLNKGILVLPGQTVAIRFEVGGTYHITSANTPGMDITVIVITVDSGSE